MEVSNSMSTLLTLFVMFTFSTTIYAQTKPSSLSDMVTRYEDWTRRFGRDYKNSIEYEFRFAIYQANVEYIDLINSQNLSFKLSDNQFADMTNEEFILMHMGVNDIEFPNVTQSPSFGHGVDVQLDLPDSVDWVEEGAVTDIKRQGKCGSCWAFSAAAALEGLNKIKTEKLESLSVQQLIDCDLHHGNNGCNGGLMDRAFNYVKANGLVSEDDYPYIGRNGKCNDDIISDPVVKITGYKDVPSFNEDALQAAVGQQPVSAAMDGQGLAFQFYSSGIFSPVFCGLRINHGITIVGYGEENGQKYWLLKNSWGTSWGESGYAKILRGNPLNLAGTCGIALKCTYPTM